MPSPVTTFASNEAWLFVFTDAGDMHFYSREVFLVATVHIGVKAVHAACVGLSSIAIAAETGLIMIDTRSFRLQTLLDESIGVVAANRFENYKEARFYYAKEGSIYEYRGENRLLYRGRARVTALMKCKKRLVFGDESGKVGIIKGDDISELIVGEHVCCIAKDGNSTAIATTVAGQAFVIDLEKGIVLQTIQVRDSAVVAIAKDGDLYFIGRDSRLVLYKRVDGTFVRFAQTDAHYSEAMCLGVFVGKVVSAGRDAIIAFYEAREDTLHFKKFYPRRRISACTGNVIAINNKTSIDFYAVGEGPRENEDALAHETEMHDKKLLLQLSVDALDAAHSQELPCRYMMQLHPKEAAVCIAFCADHFAYTTQHSTRLYRRTHDNVFRLEHLRDMEKCVDLLFFGEYLVLQNPLLISLISLATLETAKKISVPGYEKLFSLGDSLVFTESRILVGPALEETELSFPFRILDVFSGDNLYFLSKTSVSALYVVTRFDVVRNTIVDRKYIRDVHEVRGIAERGDRMFFCSSSSVYSYGLGPEFNMKKTYVSELVYSMHATPGHLVLVYDDWAKITKTFQRAAEKKKFLKK